MPGQLYGRWVPQKSATQKQSPREAKRTIAPIHSPSTQTEEKTKLRGDESTAAAVEEFDASKHTRQTLPEHPAAEPLKSIKKLKKRKRESHAENDDQVAEVTLKKHKSVLSKFEKVARRAEARDIGEAAEGVGGEQDEQEEQEDRPERVLRGEAALLSALLQHSDSHSRY